MPKTSASESENARPTLREENPENVLNELNMT